ncbi:hypothetical protein B0H14DRAFT_1128058 [Mycena olivaceomarginata]|nr:hypothetical protein B0H14DRAFT_1128058 [Mycena olivaceomarginata]
MLFWRSRARRRLRRSAMYSSVYTRGKEATSRCTTRMRMRVGKCRRFDAVSCLHPRTCLLASVQSRVELSDASSARHHAPRCAPRMGEDGAGVLRMGRWEAGREGAARLLRSTPACARALEGRTRGLKRRGGSAVSKGWEDVMGFTVPGVRRTRRDAPRMHSNLRSRGVVPSRFPPAVPSSIAESRCLFHPPALQNSHRAAFSPPSTAGAGVMRTSHAGSMRGRAVRREGGRISAKELGRHTRPAPHVSSCVSSCDEIKIAQDPLERASLPAPAWGHTGRARRHLGPSCSRVDIFQQSRLP